MLENFLYPILFMTGLVAGTIDAIAGGGGLISLPILLGIGLPPQLALGTNKLQSMMGTFMATHHFYQQGWVSLKSIKSGLCCGVLGAALGSVVSQRLSAVFLNKLIPALLLLILIYTIFSPKMGEFEKKPKLGENAFFMVFGFLLSFYDGFFGPGTGSFWVFSITFFLGFKLTKATAYTKVFNLNSNMVAVFCFALGGNIDYRLAFCMAGGQLIGGKWGAHLTVLRGTKIVRPIFISVVTVTILTLLYKNLL